MRYEKIVLASGSPRRSELLTQIGVAHDIVASGIDEQQLPGESPVAHATRLAREKALATAARQEAGGRVVLAADTVVAIGEQIFGKPADETDCVRILGALSGRTHEVVTAVAVCRQRDLRSAASVSRVRFRAIDEDERRRYWRTGEPADKAGGYAVQGYAAIFVEQLEGSFSGVMGLPLFETARLLEAAGVGLWHRAQA